jgi:thioesterase domain-containing protein
METLGAEAVTAVLHQTIPAVARLGITVDSVGPGEVTLRVPIEGNANHFGTLYAAALVAVAELPGGLIPLLVLGPGGHTPIVTDLHVRFLAPARTDVTLRARMDPDVVLALARQADTEGRAEFTLDLEGHDADGRVVVATKGQYQLRPRRR